MPGHSSSRSPLQGYNHNIKYGSRVYHVQTEDSGIDHPHLFTHLFCKGVIIATAKTDYLELAHQKGHEPKVRKLMQAQHKRLMKQLRSGDLDEKISERLGIDEVLEARKSKKAKKAPAKKAPAKEAPLASATEPERLEDPASPRAAAATAPDMTPPLMDGAAPPSMAELAAAAGVRGTAAAASQDHTSGAPAATSKSGSHPVATWLEPGELQADDSRTLRMVVGPAIDDDDEDTFVGPLPGADTSPYVESDAAFQAKAPPAQRSGSGVQSVFERPLPRGVGAATGAPADPAARSTRARPSPSHPSIRPRESPASWSGPRTPAQPRQAVPGGQRLARPAAVRPNRATGAYGQRSSHASIPQPPTGPGRTGRGSGIYQITVGGARPVQDDVPRAEAPRVIARPAVIVDRAPDKPATTIAQALSGVPPQAGQRSAVRPAPPGPPNAPQTRTLPSIFGSDLISERSLDEVILQYLSEDQE